MPELNQPAPGFNSVDQNNNPVSLSQFKGKQNVVLYFYPKDDTPGCTIEATDFSQLIDQFHTADTVVLGVSKDTAEKHRKFITKRELKIDLLVDSTGEICQQYGVWGQKSFMGKKYLGITRSTFIIDKAGNLIEQMIKVRVKGHARAVLEIVQTLN